MQYSLIMQSLVHGDCTIKCQCVVAKIEPNGENRK